MLSGFLTPFTAEDRASEIIAKAKAGVPWQASIYFDPGTFVVEEVAEGKFASVNGQQLEGPLTIIRKWMLRGCAVCPYGMDPNTETKVQFSAKQQPHVFVGVASQAAIDGLSKFAANITIPA